MNQKLKGIFEVIEAARALKIIMAPTEANQHAIKIECSRAEFLERLWELADAIERMDAANADSNIQAPVREQVIDAAKLQVAMDSVFRWMRTNNIDISEPYEMVARTLNGDKPEKKSGKGYKPLPSFAPNGFKKPVGSGPMLNLGLSIGEKASLAGLAEKELRAQMTETTLASAAPRRGRR